MSIPSDMIVVIGAMVIAAIGPAPAVPSLESSPQQPTSDVVWRSESVARADTLRHSVRGGDVLIIDLPEDIDGMAAGEYSLLEAPALSWLIDYSFMWRTMPEDAGMHNVLIHADGSADTLIVSVVVE